jgi:hypothetical protein
MSAKKINTSVSHHPTPITIPPSLLASAGDARMLFLHEAAPGPQRTRRPTTVAAAFGGKVDSRFDWAAAAFDLSRTQDLPRNSPSLDVPRGLSETARVGAGWNAHECNDRRTTMCGLAKTSKRPIVCNERLTPWFANIHNSTRG